ncbi:MAG: glycosyltransferase family 2 protein [Nitrospinae bacterium]|nr:glycosyltransferase family 2 protein [Nitrospinota bacterium]
MDNNISVIILTYNEELNISQALDSVCDWAGEIFILDSFSADKTLEIASNYNCTVYKNEFESFSKQRNYALDKLPIQTEWVLFLDADEWAPEELKNEISSVIKNNPKENGFYIKFKFIWMDKWIKRGIYPTWILRLFRLNSARCEDRSVNEHLIVDGNCGKLQNDFIHEDRKGISAWIAKHNKYATLEANELFKNINQDKYIKASLFGTQGERKRWLRYNVWNQLPPLIRPFFYFFYRYIFRGAFLEGKEAFIYHMLQAFWYRFLIDVKYLYIKRSRMD